MLKQICRTLLCIQYFIYSCNASSTSSTEQTQPNKTLSSSGSAKPMPPTNIHTISSLFSVQRQSIQQYKQLKGRLYKAANPHARIWCGLHAKQCFNVRDCVCVCVCVRVSCLQTRVYSILSSSHTWSGGSIHCSWDLLLATQLSHWSYGDGSYGDGRHLVTECDTKCGRTEPIM